MRSFLCKIIGSCWLIAAASGAWQEQPSGVRDQLRGISAVSRMAAWASGAHGTILRTADGGKTWKKLSIEGAAELDFRDIHGVDEQSAYVLSIGPGGQSRIYKTQDGGNHWQLQFINRDAKAFYDCFAFWDRNRGIAVGDSVNGQFPLISTDDGSSWAPLLPQAMPAALPEEGAFAASGTCITTFGERDVWFGTGGPQARIFHSSDRGRNWTVAATPIRSGAPSQGIFSVLFWDRWHGVVVGGDYMHPESTDKTAAYTTDGGQNWILSVPFPSGYRSAVALVGGSGLARSRMEIVAVGTNGTDRSEDGKVWVKESDSGYNAISFAGKAGWAVGPQGRIGHIAGAR